MRTAYAYDINQSVMGVDPLGLLTLADARQSLKDNGVAKQGYSTGAFGIGIPEYSNQQVFDEWLRLERKYKEETKWPQDLPTCPATVNDCSETDWEVSKSGIKNVWLWYHPNGEYEARSKTTKGGHSSQCIYDKHNKLMTEIPSAGSADFKACNSAGCEGHYSHDVETYDLAKSLGREEDYYEVRPKLISP